MVERIQSKRRRIMKDFKIHELSAVDRPSMEGALAVLMKRDDSSHEESNMNFEKIIERPRSFGSFEDAVQAIREHEGCAPLDAMEKAARAHPDLVEKMRQDGREAVAKAAATAASPRPISKALLAFNDRVDEIAKRDGIPRHDAMSRARERYAEEFAAAYGQEA